jgi:hypothetical protein
MINYRFLIKDFIKCKGNTDKFFKNRFISLNRFGLRSVPSHTSQIIIDNIKYNFDSFGSSIYYDVMNDYTFKDITKNDYVIDFGANVGIFTCQAAKLCKYIICVEPLFHKELYENIKLNNIRNYNIFNMAMSNINPIKISFGGKVNICEGISFRQLFYSIFNDINTLNNEKFIVKMDIEGAEWLLTKKDLSMIKILMMELHTFNGENPYYFEKLLINSGHKIISWKKRSKNTYIIYSKLKY